ncbi:MAG TPA: DUF1579 domain-containing protein [Allosphingosinicella sp.]|jgi:hypothetical protein
MDRIDDRNGGEAAASDFPLGRWRVRHRKLVRRLAGCTDWVAFEGEMTARSVLGGLGNLEEHVLDDPSGAYEALALRLFDPEQGLWSIWWVDGRYHELDPPVRGAFEEGIGLFAGEDMLDGRPILVRFIWSNVATRNPRWEQCFSADGGANWETNWIMQFDPLQ